jgi:hypothetical protein
MCAYVLCMQGTFIQAACSLIHPMALVGQHLGTAGQVSHSRRASRNFSEHGHQTLEHTRVHTSTAGGDMVEEGAHSVISCVVPVP